MEIQKARIFTKSEEEKLTVFLGGRLDSSNAQDFSSILEDSLQKNEHNFLILDLENLEYLSSAILRIILKLKKSEKNLKIVNASAEVYDVFEVSGFTELIDIQKAFRKISVDGCKIIGKGFYGTVYRLTDDSIVKVYNDMVSLEDIQKERNLAKKVFVHGIPTAIPFDTVKVGNLYGTVFELLNARSFNDLIIEDSKNFDSYLKIYVDFLKLIHSVKLEKDELPSSQKTYIQNIKYLKELLSENLYNKMLFLLEDLGEDTHLVHGDFQMKNVLLQDGEAMLIDMDTVSTGQPIFDLAGLFITYIMFGEDDDNNTMNFLGISNETAIRIWDSILHLYTGFTDEAKLKSAQEKIRIVACIRFAQILLSSNLKDSPLTKIRMQRVKDFLEEVLPRTDNLTL